MYTNSNCLNFSSGKTICLLPTHHLNGSYIKNVGPSISGREELRCCEHGAWHDTTISETVRCIYDCMKTTKQPLTFCVSQLLRIIWYCFCNRLQPKIISPAICIWGNAHKHIDICGASECTSAIQKLETVNRQLDCAVMRLSPCPLTQYWNNDRFYACTLCMLRIFHWNF